MAVCLGEQLFFPLCWRWLMPGPCACFRVLCFWAVLGTQSVIDVVNVSSNVCSLMHLFIHFFHSHPNTCSCVVACFLKDLFNFFCVFESLSACLCTMYVPVACKGEKKLLGLLELGFQVVRCPLGAGSWALWKNSQCSVLFRHVSRPYVFGEHLNKL